MAVGVENLQTIPPEMLEEAVRDAQAGHEDALAAVYMDTLRYAGAIIRKYGMSPDFVEEESQEIATRIWRAGIQKGQYESGTFHGYVSMATKNRLKDVFRRSERIKITPAEEVDLDDYNPELSAEEESAASDWGNVERLMEQCGVTDEFRPVLRDYLEGMSSAQIAAKNSIPVATVRTRTHRSLNQIREYLGIQKGEKPYDIFQETDEN